MCKEMAKKEQPLKLFDEEDIRVIRNLIKYGVIC